MNINRSSPRDVRLDGLHEQRPRMDDLQVTSRHLKNDLRFPGNETNQLRTPLQSSRWFACAEGQVVWK